MQTYKEREHEVAPHGEVEVVLLGAASIDALKQTHSSYFGGSERLREVLVTT